VPLIANRDDWAFSLFGLRLICVTHNPFASTVEVRRTLDQLDQMVSLIAQPVGSPGAQTLEHVPAGFADDPSTFERQLEGLTPEEQAALIVASGHVPPGVTEEQVAEAIRRDQQ
jgi:hypothetical protein